MEKKFYEAIQNNNNVITTEEAVSFGISKTMLTKYTREGELERVRHGVYILPNSIHDDMYTLSLVSKKIIFSHDTALFLHGLSDRTPFIHSITIPSTASIPASIKEKCNCFYIKPELYEMGLTWKKNTFGNSVRCYDPERTICDILRSRNRIDEETVINAIKKYATYKEKKINVLGEYAEKLRIFDKIQKYMEVLL